MLFVVALQDIPDNTKIRARLLDAHMAHIGNDLEHIKLGGPLLRGDSDPPAGGVLVIEPESESQVRERVQADPHYKEGLWEDVKIHAFRGIINAWQQDDTNP